MRDAAKHFLAHCGWQDAVITPIAGDLSSRSYSRVTKDDRNAILMDAADDEKSTLAFMTISDWLQGIGLSAPKIFAAKPEKGLLLLEDFGNVSGSQMLATPGMATDIYDNCLHLLLAIRNAQPPSLDNPDARTLANWTHLVEDHYPNADVGAIRAFRAELETILADCLKEEPTVSLRDFHADNLMWLPDREGVQRLGLLDFQDAFLTHPVYDLVSLLTDARTQVSAVHAPRNDEPIPGAVRRRSRRIWHCICRPFGAAQLAYSWHLPPRRGR